jgi:hypothetical protein
MIVETEDLRWFRVRYINIHKYDLVKYNRTDVNSNLIRIEFLRTNYYKKLEYKNDMYEDIVVDKKNNLEEGECFVYIDDSVPNDRLIRLTKTLKDRYGK